MLCQSCKCHVDCIGVKAVSDEPPISGKLLDEINLVSESFACYYRFAVYEAQILLYKIRGMQERAKEHNKKRYPEQPVIEAGKNNRDAGSQNNQKKRQRSPVAVLCLGKRRDVVYESRNRKVQEIAH